MAEATQRSAQHKVATSADCNLVVSLAGFPWHRLASEWKTQWRTPRYLSGSRYTSYSPPSVITPVSTVLFRG